jgi:hypothetical protein
MHARAIVCFVATTLTFIAPGVLAEPSSFVGGAIDPNTFIVGHPASPRWKTVHSNHEHPAVIQAERAKQGRAIDANTFIVQPPASVQWLPSPTADDRPVRAHAQSS